MWFLGAGVSVSAGIPTAEQMIWQFKQQLYVAQRKAERESIADLTNPAIRALLNSHIEGSDNMPKSGSPAEYAALFEATYPSEKDRATFIQGMIDGARPVYGHLSLATLLKAGHSHLVWTTNFDHLLEDACAKVFDTTSALSAVALDAPALAQELISGQKWPIEIKLHGDFRSRNLKNTADELRQQDASLRRQLVDACRRFGLVVAGYSGRDDSIMDSLENALEEGGAFPSGLFWLHRGDWAPYERVSQLIGRATETGVEAALVRIENFDEIMRDQLRQLDGLDTSALEALPRERRRISAAPQPAGKAGWPVVRLNGIEVTSTPKNCRKVVCDIGGFSEIREAIEAAGADLLFTRVRAGILGFGSDDAFRLAFEKFDISEFDLSTIETKRLRFDSGERGLLLEALVRALCREKGLRSIRRRGYYTLLVDEPNGEQWADLRQIVGRIEGSLAGHDEITWHEAVSVRLEWADERLWLLIDPQIAFEGTTEETKAISADFARERTFQRYNQQLDKLIDFWATCFAGDRLAAFGIGDGIDASFSLTKQTAFSRRAQA